jgi:hypothetical protein
LYEQKTIDTVRKNRKNIPKDLPINILKKDYVHRTYSELLALRWRDKHDVCRIATKHAFVELTEVVGKQNKKTLKPNYVVEYNKGIGGVDLNDQMLTCISIMRKLLKDYKKLFFTCLT